MGGRTRRTPLIERLWWDLESLTWDDQLADAGKRADVDTVVGWLTALQAGPRERVLDVGCGTGNYAVALARSGFDVTGFDVSPAMLRRARAKAAGSDVNVTFASVDLHRGLDVPESSFEWVICIHVLQVVRDAAAFLRDVHRVLVPGGRLALVAFDGGECREGDLSARMRALSPRTTRRRAAFSVVKRAVVQRSRQVRTYTSGELADILTDVGFVAIDDRALPGRPAVIARRS